MNVVVSSNLLSVEWQGSGELIGWRSDNHIYILRPQLSTNTLIDAENIIKDYVGLMQNALQVVGLFCAADAPDVDLLISNMRGGDVVLLYSAHKGTESGTVLEYYLIPTNGAKHKNELLKVEPRYGNKMEEVLKNEFVLVSSQLQIPLLYVQKNRKTNGELLECLKKCINDIKQNLDFVQLSQNPDTDIKDLVSKSNSFVHLHPNLINVDAYLALPAAESLPLIEVTEVNSGATIVSERVCVDCAIYFHPTASCSFVRDQLRTSVVQQMEGILLFLERNPQVFEIPRPHSFIDRSKLCPDWITVFFPHTDAENDAFEVSLRRAYHSILFLPQKCPLLRRRLAVRNLLRNLQAIIQSGHLINVHLGVSPPTIQGTIHTVRGSYAYYHYRQDNINDEGWGCAYRSMQTLCSWLIAQGFISADVPPSHLAIQKELVKIGDKPRSLINSKQWIGATEISLCLDSLYKIPCKILHVRSGDDMYTLGTAIAQHFDTVASPIMIGGGVLAYTLLGILIPASGLPKDYRYLILDPHYTGKADVSTIIQKKWCEWKDPSIFYTQHFYNLCLPQTMTGI